MAFDPDPVDLPTIDETRHHVDRRRAVRFGLAGVAILVAVLFMAQNNERVELNFLMFGVSTRLWVGLLVALVLGAVLGQAAEVLWDRRKRRRAES